MKKIDINLESILNNPKYPSVGIAVATIKNYNLSYEGYFGYRNLEKKLLLNKDSIIRVASISKLVTAIAVMKLVQFKLLDLDIDISEYLGYEFRNPNFKEEPITTRMLLSHTSSIRDGNTYNYPVGVNIFDIFKDKNHWASDNGNVSILDDKVIDDTNSSSKRPGEYFYYSNLNYGLVATIIEKIINTRFDIFMNNTIFNNLTEPATFNLNTLNNNQFQNLATLYRLDSSEKWIPQTNDNKYKIENLDKYKIGSNGTIFGPHGNLRTTLKGLVEIMKNLFINHSSILNNKTLNEFFKPVWTYNENLKNGNTYWGLMGSYGSGIHRLTEKLGDKLLLNKSSKMIGHSAEAYGLLGGLYFNSYDGNGVVYLVTGTDFEIENYTGTYSSFYKYEEDIINAVKDTFL